MALATAGLGGFRSPGDYTASKFPPTPRNDPTRGGTQLYHLTRRNAPETVLGQIHTDDATFALGHPLRRRASTSATMHIDAAGGGGRLIAYGPHRPGMDALDGPYSFVLCRPPSVAFFVHRHSQQYFTYVRNARVLAGTKQEQAVWL